MPIITALTSTATLTSDQIIDEAREKVSGYLTTSLGERNHNKSCALRLAQAYGMLCVLKPEAPATDVIALLNAFAVKSTHSRLMKILNETTKKLGKLPAQTDTPPITDDLDANKQLTATSAINASVASIYNAEEKISSDSNLRPQSPTLSDLSEASTSADHSSLERPLHLRRMRALFSKEKEPDLLEQATSFLQQINNLIGINATRKFALIKDLCNFLVQNIKPPTASQTSTEKTINKPFSDALKSEKHEELLEISRKDWQKNKSERGEIYRRFNDTLKEVIDKCEQVLHPQPQTPTTQKPETQDITQTPAFNTVANNVLTSSELNLVKQAYIGQGLLLGRTQRRINWFFIKRSWQKMPEKATFQNVKLTFKSRLASPNLSLLKKAWHFIAKRFKTLPHNDQEPSAQQKQGSQAALNKLTIISEENFKVQTQSDVISSSAEGVFANDQNPTPIQPSWKKPSRLLTESELTKLTAAYINHTVQNQPNNQQADSRQPEPIDSGNADISKHTTALLFAPGTIITIAQAGEILKKRQQQPSMNPRDLFRKRSSTCALEILKEIKVENTWQDFIDFNK